MMHFNKILFSTTFLVISSFETQSTLGSTSQKFLPSLRSSIVRGCNGFDLEDGQVAFCLDFATGAKNPCPKKEIQENTIAHIRCDQFWEPIGDVNKIIKRCSRGVWSGESEKDLKCEVKCGLANLYEGPHAHGEKREVLKGNIPWTVGIYVDNEPNDKKKIYDFKCFGTLLSRRTIITSADCVIYPNSEIERRNEDFLFKFYEADEDVNRRNVHLSKGEMNWNKNEKVQKIVIHPDFNNLTLDSNLAIIWLTKNLILTKDIHPVCLKEDSYNASISSQGIVSLNRPSSFPLELELSIVDLTFCHSSEFGENLYCTITYQDESKLCERTLGSGFVMSRSKLVNEEMRHFLKGVRTRQGEIPNCEEPLFTKIDGFIPWINKELKREPPLYETPMTMTITPATFNVREELGSLRRKESLTNFESTNKSVLTPHTTTRSRLGGIMEKTRYEPNQSSEKLEILDFKRKSTRSTTETTFFFENVNSNERKTQMQEMPFKAFKPSGFISQLQPKLQSKEIFPTVIIASY